MIIFGTRTKVFRLAMLALVCGGCGNQTAHALVKRVTKFTLFFIPLFPVRTKHLTQCTACGFASELSADQAERERARSEIRPAG